MTIGERIKKLRQEKHLTQQNLATNIGISQNGMALIESGKRNPSNQTIMSISREFHVNENWLRTGEGEMFLPQDEENLLLDASLDAADRAILRAYIDAPPALRTQIKQLILNAADNIRESAVPPVTAPTPEEREIAKRVAAYDAGQATCNNLSRVEPPKPEGLTDDEWERILADRERDRAAFAAEEKGVG